MKLDPARTGVLESARREPHLELHPTSDPALRRPMLSQRGRRWTRIVIVLSLLVHGILLLLIILFGGRGGYAPREDAVPVQLVLETPHDPLSPPPPPPPPPPKQQPQQSPPPPPPPPPGRLASDDLGMVDGKSKQLTGSQAPAAGQVEPKPGEAPPPPADSPPTPKPSEVARPKPVEDPSQSAAPEQEDIKETVDKLAKGGALAPPIPAPKPVPPQDQVAAKPVPKPNPVHFETKPGGAQRPNEHEAEPAHADGHEAKVPGPDATYDEYLAYAKLLINQRIAQMPPSLFRGRHGHVKLDMRLFPSGAVALVGVLEASGYPDADDALRHAINEIGRFPPVPDHFTRNNGSIALIFVCPINDETQTHP